MVRETIDKVIIDACTEVVGQPPFPVLQTTVGDSVLEFPAVVYYRIAQLSDDGIEGQFIYGVSYRLDFRAETYAQAKQIHEDTMGILRKSGRIIQDLGIIDQDDQELGVYRVIQVLTFEV